MRLLLDTLIALWAIADHPNLSTKARNLTDDPDNQIVVSAATIWEIAIKHALARGHPTGMPISSHEALGYFRNAGFEVLDISPAHAAAVETLPSPHGKGMPDNYRFGLRCRAYPKPLFERAALSAC